MNLPTTPRCWRAFLAALALALVALPAYPQVTLTGAIQFSTTSTGAASGGLLWNTLPGDSYYNLWLALNPNATLPVNGPADSQAGISLPLAAGNTYKYYIFGQPGPGTITGFNGLNLFLDGNNSTPAISAYFATNSTGFLPNTSSTLTLAGAPVPGSGNTAYSSSGVVVVLTGYDWNLPAALPGDVCQAFTFTPGNQADYSGTFSLQVFPAAALTSSLPSAPPGTKITLTGTGFAAEEMVNIYLGSLASPPLAVTTNAGGAFTVTGPTPAARYGPEEIYALGQSSGKLGVTSIFVTPALLISPRKGTPGSTAAAQGVGFGSGEPVDVYWANPRQLLGTATAGGDGSFVRGGALEFTIPANAPPGTNAITATGRATGAIAIGRITVE